MRVEVTHGETRTGVVFVKRFYTVTAKVTFSAEELAIIRERKLEKDVILQRSPPVNAKVTEVTGILSAGKVLTGMGKTVNGFHLMIGTLMNGPDTYTLETPLEAKRYEAELMAKLKECKDYIMGNAEKGTGGVVEF